MHVSQFAHAVVPRMLRWRWRAPVWRVQRMWAFLSSKRCNTALTANMDQRRRQNLQLKACVRTQIEFFSARSDARRQRFADSNHKTEADFMLCMEQRLSPETGEADVAEIMRCARHTVACALPLQPPQ